MSLRKHALSRQFNSPDVISLAAPLMSTYVLPGAKRALEELDLPDDHYILGVTYRLAENIRHCTGDSQLFVTGTVMRQEASWVACFRELSEEVMARPTSIDKLQYLHCASEVTRSSHTRAIDWYGCAIAELEPTGPPPERPAGSRDGRHKIGCILHGTHEEVLELFERLAVTDAGSDGIVGIACLQVRSVKKMLKLIPKYYKPRDHFYWCHNGGTEEHPRPPRDLFAFSGEVVPSGAACTIRVFAESMSLTTRKAKTRIMRLPPPYCDVTECLEPAMLGIGYCDAHRQQ